MTSKTLNSTTRRPRRIASEKASTYALQLDQIDEQVIIDRALAILDRRLFCEHPALGSPRDTAEYLRVRLAGRSYEVFCCVWLDTRHRPLKFEEMFRGTINGSSVHPREVVRAALEHNAAAVIFAHNHPSGASEPSAADRAITLELRDALRLIDVRVLDHFVVGEGKPTSLAERGLI